MDARKHGRNLTEQQASDERGMSVHWYRRKRWEGGGPVYIKTSNGKGGKVLYPEEELDKYFNSRLRKSTSDRGPAAK